MKAILMFVLFGLFANAALANSQEAFDQAFEALNEEIKHELLHGDLSSKTIKRSIKIRIERIGELAREVGGKRFQRSVKRSFKQTLVALSVMDRTYKQALDFTYANGLTGREIVMEAMDAANNQRIVDIYKAKKDYLRAAYSGQELKNRAFEMMLTEIESDEQFAFMKLDAPKNFIQKDSIFNFIKEKCVPKYGEEDFFLALFGFNRCTGDKYVVDRYTVGVGYYNSPKSHSLVTGLKIGKKGFTGIGARIIGGIKKGGGFGIFIGNGLILSLDVEEGYGLYAGGTYLRIKIK